MLSKKKLETKVENNLYEFYCFIEHCGKQKDYTSKYPFGAYGQKEGFHKTKWKLSFFFFIFILRFIPHLDLHVFALGGRE